MFVSGKACTRRGHFTACSVPHVSDRGNFDWWIWETCIAPRYGTAVATIGAWIVRIFGNCTENGIAGAKGMTKWGSTCGNCPDRPRQSVWRPKEPNGFATPLRLHELRGGILTWGKAVAATEEERTDGKRADIICNAYFKCKVGWSNFCSTGVWEEDNWG